MKRRDDFNKLAPFYDLTCTLVYGRSVRNAQIKSLSFIPAGSTILIAGGGTGWILEEIAQVFPSGQTITYLDKSSEMIRRAQQRNVGNNVVTFITDDILTAELATGHYDVVFTPFFLDCFTQENITEVFRKLDNSLKPGGIWINVDFFLTSESTYWQKALIKIMYLFFRLSCNIETDTLPSTDSSFKKYTLTSEQGFLRNFILLQVFHK